MVWRMCRLIVLLVCCAGCIVDVVVVLAESVVSAVIMLAWRGELVIILLTYNPAPMPEDDMTSRLYFIDYRAYKV